MKQNFISSSLLMSVYIVHDESSGFVSCRLCSYVFKIGKNIKYRVKEHLVTLKHKRNVLDVEEKKLDGPDPLKLNHSDLKMITPKKQIIEPKKKLGVIIKDVIISKNKLVVPRRSMTETKKNLIITRNYIKKNLTTTRRKITESTKKLVVTKSKMVIPKKKVNPVKNLILESNKVGPSIHTINTILSKFQHIILHKVTKQLYCSICHSFISTNPSYLSLRVKRHVFTKKHKKLSIILNENLTSFKKDTVKTIIKSSEKSKVNTKCSKKGTLNTNIKFSKNNKNKRLNKSRSNLFILSFNKEVYNKITNLKNKNGFGNDSYNNFLSVVLESYENMTSKENCLNTPNCKSIKEECIEYDIQDDADDDTTRVYSDKFTKSLDKNLHINIKIENTDLNIKNVNETFLLNNFKNSDFQNVINKSSNKSKNVESNILGNFNYDSVKLEHIESDIQRIRNPIIDTDSINIPEIFLKNNYSSIFFDKNQKIMKAAHTNLDVTVPSGEDNLEHYTKDILSIDPFSANISKPFSLISPNLFSSHILFN